MPRPLFTRLLVVFALLLLLGAGLTVWQRGLASDAWFCEAAQHPDAYEDEWFYTLERGPEGWLLRHDDLREDFTLDEETETYLTRFSRALHTEGVILIVAAQPPRGVVLAPGNALDYDPRAALSRYEEARDGLTDAGVLSADFAEAALATPNYFFKRDHHWTPEGADASARTVAALIRDTDVYTALTPLPYRTERVGQASQLGSYGEAVGRICGQNPPEERFTQYQTRPPNTQQDDDALFGNASAPPIALAGTSNSASEEFNFAGFLAQHAELEVLNVSAVGGGPEAALAAFLRSETFTENPPRFLVWEFATLFDLPRDPVFYRQLIPSIGGACAASESVQSAAQGATEGTLTLFENLPRSSDADDLQAPYIYLEATDLSLVNFEVDVGYQNGETETVRLERPTRTANDGRFFLELTGAVSSLSLTLPMGVGGEISARLCPQ